MEYIYNRDFYNLSYDILDMTNDNKLKGKICVELICFTNRARIFEEEFDFEISCHIAHYHDTGEKLDSSGFNESFPKNKLIDFLIYLDEYFTEYNCKNDEENNNINEFLFLYRKKIRKYLV
jgi:hypothetical protein